MSMPTLTDHLLEEAEEAIALDNLEHAKACYQRILEIEPDNMVANLALQEFARDVAPCKEVTAEAEVSLAREPEETLLPTEVFVLSQLAHGPIAVSRIVAAGRVPEAAVLLVLKRFANRGVIAVH